MFVCKRGVVFDRRPDQRVLRSAGLVTIFLVYASDAQHFDVRKGGALEDPAVGMVQRHSRDIFAIQVWPHAGVIDIAQSDDMGCGC